MLSRCRGLSFAGLALLSALTIACEKSPLLAPTGSSITLTTATNVLSPSGSAEIVAQVLEAAGTPPHSGTEITFTTTLGTIQPQVATTDASGRAIVIFEAGASNGTASIAASSGGASTGANGLLKIAVGTAAVGAVRVNANPASVSALGGSTTITANVLDINGNVLKGVPVVFSTTAGALSASVVTTDLNGAAQAVLTTSQQAVVTASVGAQAGSSSGGTGTGTGGTGTGTGGTGTGTTPTTGQASGTVTITVNASATLVITPPTAAPSAGIPSAYTFVVTVPAANGSPVRSLIVNWGDGSQSQNLGAVTGTQVAFHTYQSTGSFVITGTLTDSSGNVTPVSTVVNVIPVASPTITITPSIPSSCTGTGACNVTFTVQVTPPTGVGIVDVTIDFGDGATAGLGGLTGSATISHTYAVHSGATVILKVTDTLGRSTQGFTTITIP